MIEAGDGLALLDRAQEGAEGVRVRFDPEAVLRDLRSLLREGVAR